MHAAINRKPAPNAELMRVHPVFSQATSTLFAELTALRNSLRADSLASQVFAEHAAAFVKYLAALLPIDAIAAPSDYRDGYIACYVYANQTREFFRDKAISCAQTSPTATFSTADIDELTRRLTELQARMNNLYALAGRYVK